MIDIRKFSGKDESEIKSEVLHTSGHARIERGDQIGSTGTQSFQQRVELTQKESRTIGHYRHSAVGGRFGVLKAKQSTPQTSRLKRAAPPSDAHSSSGGTSRSAFNSGSTAPQKKPSPGFKEPPSRGYNPYA